MIDIRRVRSDLDGVKAAMARRHAPQLVADLDELARLDERARDLTIQRDELRSRVNTLSKAVADAFRSGDREKAEALKEESRAAGEHERAVATEVDAVSTAVRDLLLRIPNIPADEAPDGRHEEENVVVRVEQFDETSYGDHQRVPHWETGKDLGILDLERAAKLSGSMFSLFRGPGATLVRALCQYALDRNADAFEEIRPPSLVRTDALVATGQLPKFVEDSYFVEKDELWAIPTAETPLTSMYADEVLDEAILPKRMMAYTPCYRREAGAAGRDTRGTLRVHEFDKVEILALCTADQAKDVHAELIARAEGAIRDLGLGYRVLDLCTGDLGQSHARCVDLEVYAPGVGTWLEASSISWFSDYQARRANIRYRPTAAASGTELVHTLNGSALATPRVWAALVEHYRQPDGSVAVPDVLRPYFRGLEVIRPA